MKDRYLGLMLVSLLLGLLAACGPLPEVPEADPPEEAAETERIDGLFSAGEDDAVEAENETDTDTEEAVPTVAVAVNDSDLAQTADGITVGFTAEGRPFMGNPEADIVIEEFSDYQCPYCGRFFGQTWPTIKADNVATGEVMIVFYDFPLSFHEQGEPAAQAARCAGEEGAVAYWQMHDLLFANLNEWGTPDYLPVFQGYAAELGLDEAAFTDCVTSERYADAVQADIALGRERGVTGTPTFFINDQPLVGALPASAFANAIAQVQAGEPLAQAPDPTDTAEVDISDIPPFQMPEPVEVTPSTVATLGDEDAPITIVEFSDYQCPFCRRHVEETMPSLLAELVETGRVRYEFKDFPLDNIHPEARKASEAARCAGDQKAYWEMHDSLFATQEQWGGQPNANEVFVSLADELGLDTAVFSDCLTSGKYTNAVQADVAEGTALGITGTPTFFIGGYGISGAQPLDLFQMVVEAIETDTLEDLFREAYDAQVEAIRAQRAAEAQQPPAPPTPSGPVDVPTEGWPTIGDPDAPVTIVEYTDFQCPYCGRHVAQTFPQIKENYIDTGLVRYVFKDFPLSFHLEAEPAALAARCAHDQEAFMEMHEVLFSRQGEWGGQSNVTDIFVGYADELGLDTAVFSECVNSDKYVTAVQADLAEGSQIGVTGTPSFLINGNLVVGALPYSTFEQAIESALAASE